MGMRATYKRLPKDEWERIRSLPNFADTYYGISLEDEAACDVWQNALEREGRILEIGKSWDALHFLLTGRRTFGDECVVPRNLHNAVGGGTDTPYESAVGFVRWLSSTEVRDTSAALDALNENGLRENFMRNLQLAGNIYNFNGQDKLEPLMICLARVREFFQLAAQNGDIILFSID